MITHILVPIDDTELSIRAIPVAGTLARMAGATIDLLTVDHLGWPADLEEERLDEVTHLVPPGVGVSAAVVATTDSVADTLARLDHPEGTILCLATHGRGPLGSLGLGSVTAHLVAHALMPVLVVGPSCTSQGPTDLGGPVLAAVDGSDRDEDVLRAAVQWSKATGSGLVVTTTITRPSEPEAWSEANDLLADARRVAAEMGVEAEALPVAAADVDEGVLRAIDGTTGCVVMGSHRRGRLGRLLFGSTTAPVVRHASCPVLVAAPSTAGRRIASPGSATERHGGG